MKIKNNIIKLIIGITALLLIINIFIPFTTSAKVMVFPTRVTFENGVNYATIRLINTEDETITYRIVFIQSKMYENGKIERIDKPSDKEQRLTAMMAQDLIRYSPRQVTLPPNEEQLVRLQLSKPADLKEGEYRSRLLFQEIPQISDSQEASPEAREGFSIQLQVIYGVSIPVIVRHGETKVDVELTDFDLEISEEDGIPIEMSFEIKRSGNQSVYGDIEVKYISEDGIERIIGRLRRVGVYTEINSREITLNLTNTENINLETGKIMVVYKQPPEQGNEILASQEI
ncbi:MAG TPA: DUF916 domain-containing protein [Halanaerobiales bacterium]|nr:DUF916 domain-containing protein [Halanaerobiales bacterium]